MASLQGFGLSTVPVVAVGDQHVTGARLDLVAELLDIDHDDTPALAPGALIKRLTLVLATAMRLAGQIPSDRRRDSLPHRDRSYLGLVNHLVQIVVGFLEVVDGARLSGRRAAAVPAVEVDVEALTARAASLIVALEALTISSNATNWERTVETYVGDQDLHRVLERTTWHCAQHTRQLAMVLELLEVEPDDPLASPEFAGLPMPTEVWDG